MRRLLRRGLVDLSVRRRARDRVRRGARLLRLSVRVSAAAGGRAARPRPIAPRWSPTGTFIHANPSDPIHWGRGKVSVYERAVFLEPDFEVGPGPGLPRLSRAEGRHPRNRPTWSTRCTSISAACAPSRAASATPIPAGVNLQGLSERRHLVRAVQRADLAGRSRLAKSQRIAACSRFRRSLARSSSR